MFASAPNTRRFPWIVAVFTIGLAPTMAVAAGPASGQGWVRAPSEDFELCIPPDAVREERTTETVVGDVETTVWLRNGPQGQYAVTFSHLPTLASIFATRGTMFNRAAAKMMDELGAELVSQRSIDWGVFEREVDYRIRDADGVVVAEGKAMFGYRDGTVVVLNTVSVPGHVSAAQRFLHAAYPQTPCSA